MVFAGGSTDRPLPGLVPENTTPDSPNTTFFIPMLCNSSSDGGGFLCQWGYPQHPAWGSSMTLDTWLSTPRNSPRHSMAMKHTHTQRGRIADVGKTTLALKHFGVPHLQCFCWPRMVVQKRSHFLVNKAIGIWGAVTSSLTNPQLQALVFQGSERRTKHLGSHMIN